MAKHSLSKVLKVIILNVAQTRIKCIYANDLDKHACANSLDQDQTPHNGASDQGLHCLLLIQ